MGEGSAPRNEKGALAGLDGALRADYMQPAWPVNRLPLRDLGGTVAACGLAGFRASRRGAGAAERGGLENR